MIVTIQLDTRQEDDADLLAKLGDLFGGIPVVKEVPTGFDRVPAPEVASVKRGPGRPRKEAKAADTGIPAPVPVFEPVQEAASTAEDGEEVTTSSAPAPVTPPAEPAMTVAEFRTKAVAYAKQHGGQALLAILKGHGYTNIGAVPDEKIAAVAAELV